LNKWLVFTVPCALGAGQWGYPLKQTAEVLGTSAVWTCSGFTGAGLRSTCSVLVCWRVFEALPHQELYCRGLRSQVCSTWRQQKRTFADNRDKSQVGPGIAIYTRNLCTSTSMYFLPPFLSCNLTANRKSTQQAIARNSQ